MHEDNIIHVPLLAKDIFINFCTECLAFFLIKGNTFGYDWRSYLSYSYCVLTDSPLTNNILCLQDSIA